MKEVHQGRASSMTVTNYKKDGRPFRNLVHVYPLSSDSSNDVTHMLGTSQAWGSWWGVRYGKKAWVGRREEVTKSSSPRTRSYDLPDTTESFKTLPKPTLPCLTFTFPSSDRKACSMRSRRAGAQ